ncbi:bifunctional folylpolyglutamate synthase/dihydrofolate synthase [Caproiciproducens sp. NJN-50]|uniref:bifunctional folylpolyglutamate synthase/dihydrofolate synthase n=1 Tax=Acutalibacteraceae TaxID=3082771 RepID=UPI000FFE1548|nr:MULTISPECIES: folylpolyglutamate synthase/dihydrofolate synthase family protein [Acutalibacteraceae]QAT50131.1 bifunctional folylpolyglutamate synthase/dihydrofolate synthase [Caproiciproducens sp. NJN-50]
MTYEEAVRKIESLQQFGSRPGLERIRGLMGRLGNPQDGLRFVHVAGTNGKGTTCALLASVLCRAGYRTGLYLSPHLSDFRERMQIDGEMISHSDLASLAGRVFPEIEEMESQGEMITEFEAVTAMAFLWYADKACDLVVLEVGLGGRLDATNVIQKPLVSVITSISLDHTKILGDTVEQIALEKCGIIKEGGVTVSYPDQKPGAAETIRRTSMERHNRLVETAVSGVRELSTDLFGTELSWNGIRLHLPFLGEHQVKNAVTALAVLDVLRNSGYSIPEEAVKQGFSEAVFPARFEVLSRSPLVILDGAHNPDGTAALASAVRQYLPGRGLIAVMGMLKDKDVDAALKNLSGLFSYVITTEPSSPRAMSAHELAERWRRLGIPAEPAAGQDEALRMAHGRLSSNGALLICGSLYLAGAVRSHALKLWSPAKK